MTEEKKMFWECPYCGRKIQRDKAQVEVRCICGVVMTATVEKEGTSKKLDIIKD